MHTYWENFQKQGKSEHNRNEYSSEGQNHQQSQKGKPETEEETLKIQCELFPKE